MGTKLNPGAFDCHDKAEPDEPHFTVLARDRQAPELVRNWAWQRAEMIKHGVKPESDRAQVLEALQVANAMEVWHQNNRS